MLEYFNTTALVAMHWRDPCWLVSGDRKLIGPARLRQLRTAEGFCYVSTSMASLTSKKCVNEFYDFYRDQRLFNAEWTEYNFSTMGRRFVMPFRHMDEPDAQSVPIWGHIGRIPRDGYVAFLGRTLFNTRFALTNLCKLKWFDEFTRVVLMEFTTYSVDINLFNLVQLLIERTGSGVNHIAYQVRHFIDLVRFVATLEVNQPKIEPILKLLPRSSMQAGTGT